MIWVLNEAEYNQLRDIHRNRLTTEIPGAIVLNIWKNFTHIGDGLHPASETVKKAAAKIVEAIGTNKK